jgi:hypothetical protein
MDSLLAVAAGALHFMQTGFIDFFSIALVAGGQIFFLGAQLN